MILDYVEFKSIFNERLFEGSRKDLFQKLASIPDRYVGLFRPSKPYTKIIQNITQSHEIRFGDALEELAETYLTKYGYTFLDNSLIYEEDGKSVTLNIDLLFCLNDTLFLVEQKVRDDHDSTKKVGQFQNFEKKYKAVKQKYGNQYTIHSIMWFVDDSLKKNRTYYINEMTKMKEKEKCNVALTYGEEFFIHLDQIMETNKHVMIWDEWKSYLKKWKKELPNLPIINFDEEAEEVLQELVDFSINDYRKIFNNEQLKEEILPILSPNKVLLKLLLEELEFKKKTNLKNKRAFDDVIVSIKEYIKEH